MKDSEWIIIKAFIFALTQQQDSLSEEIISQLQAIASSLEGKVMDLHNLALNHLSLKVPYQNARRWFNSTSAERGMGLDVLPAEDNGDENSREIDNITRDAQKDTQKMEQFLKTIDNQYNQVGQVSQVFSAANPVQAIRNQSNRFF